MIYRFVVLAFATAVCANAQVQLSKDDLARVDAVVRQAFSSLYALPSDTAAARMGSWVIDSAATTLKPDSSGRWRIVVTKLSDTGRALELKEMVGEPGTSPAQLAAAAAAMRRLEGKISKADADATFEITVIVNPAEITVPAISEDAKRTTPEIPGAQLALRVHGDWTRIEDRDLEIDYQRWSPATVIVAFGSIGPVEAIRVNPEERLVTWTIRGGPPRDRGGLHTIAVIAQGNEEMLDRAIQEIGWDVLAALLKG